MQVIIFCHCAESRHLKQMGKATERSVGLGCG